MTIRRTITLAAAAIVAGMSLYIGPLETKADGDVLTNPPSMLIYAAPYSAGFGSVTSVTYEVYARSIPMLSLGHYESMAWLDQGDVWSSGEAAALQAHRVTEPQNKLNKMEGIQEAVKLAAGLHHLVLKRDGTVMSWGYNASGQLGDGTTADRQEPLPVPGLADVTEIATGLQHSLAIRSDGTVWAWGNNEYGQLGDGTKTARSIPGQVQGLHDIVAISAGLNHNLALSDDGKVWAWGDNALGQLGDGTMLTRLIPVQVDTLDDVAAISAGVVHNLALKIDGTVWTWGYEQADQQPGKPLANRTIPEMVEGLNDVKAIAAGMTHSLALQSNGSVWAWGTNEAGQLGDGTTHNRTVPVQVPGLIALQVDASMGTNGAVGTDGLLYLWGEGRFVSVSSHQVK